MRLTMAQWLIQWMNWSERNDKTRYWNPWVVRRKVNP